MRSFWTLGTKIIATFLVPALLTVGLFVWYASFRLREGLDAELGRRLVAVAQAAVPLLPPDQVSSFLPEDQQSRTYRNLRQKLLRLRRSTGVRRIYVFDRNRTSLLDTRSVPIGQEYVYLSFERDELGAVFQGKSRSSILFRDKSGVQYKTGFAPIHEGDEVVASVAVEGSAAYFQILGRTRRSMFFFGLLSLLLVVVTGVLFSRWLASPVRQLLQAAKNIGQGELTQPIAYRGRDEIGFLAETMDEMRQNILARDQQMQMMLSGIAHEVRNPLGGMELFSSILYEELAGDEEKMSHVERIRRELHYLTNVVNNFLDYARPASLDITPTDWRDFVTEIAMLMMPEADEKQLKLQCLTDDNVEKVPLDRDGMQQVLLNLLKNAIQASPPNSTITLQMSRQEQHFLLSLHDQGPGIPQERHKKIFEPFFTTREKGTGLGLPLVRKIVEAHHGSIGLESPPEQGTTFLLQLPLQPPSLQ